MYVFKHTYPERECNCGKTFKPNSPHQRRCGECIDLSGTSSHKAYRRKIQLTRHPVKRVPGTLSGPALEQTLNQARRNRGLFVDQEDFS